MDMPSKTTITTFNLIAPIVNVDTLYYPSHDLCQVERGRKYSYIDLAVNRTQTT